MVSNSENKWIKSENCKSAKRRKTLKLGARREFKIKNERELKI
jgi:hypothetical protein